MKNLTGLKLLILISILSVFVLSACNSEEGVKWYDSKDEAIENGLKEERLTKQNIVDELSVGKETFIIIKDGEHTITAVNLAKKNKKFSWFRSNAYTQLNESLASWELESESKDNYVMYGGILTDESITIDTTEGINTPVMNEKEGIYYYLSKK